MEPNFMAARSMLGHAYEQKGHYEKAIAEYRIVLKTFGENADVKSSIKALLARAYARWGKHPRATRIVQEIEKEYPTTPYLMAQVFGILGEKERAFACLEKAFDERHFQLVGVKADPALDSLRADSRFADFVRRMRF